MSFTLRTLLAYLDNAPLPTEEHEPIQSALDQNPAAQELVHRIRTLLAQPRMASPAVETAGVLQANQVAEYLDGTSEFDVTKKFEQTCLKNDAALSEIAALHQILTDWIDQPTYISDELRQRIYQFAGSWADMPAIDEATQSPRTVGRDAIQAAAQLLQVRELDMPVDSIVAVNSNKVPTTNAGTGGSLQSTIRHALGSTTAATQPAPGKPDVQSAKMATVATGSAAPEESGQGGWILALLVLVGFGFLWWSQQNPAPMAGMAQNQSKVDAASKHNVTQPSSNAPTAQFQLPPLPSAGSFDEANVVQRAPSAVIPPIHLSSGPTLPPVSIGSSGRSTPSNIAPTDRSTEAALSIPTLPDPVLELPKTPTVVEPNLIPSFAEPDLLATDLSTPETANRSAESTPTLPPNSPGSLEAFPLAELKPTNVPDSPPIISALPPVEEEGDLVAPSIDPAIITPSPSSAIANNPLVPAPKSLNPAGTGALPSIAPAPLAPAPLAPTFGASTPDTSTPLVPAPTATNSTTSSNLSPLEWGQQIGTVVMEAPAGESQDDWILVLPGGRSELQVRSPRGKAWNFKFSGISRYRLQENQGLPQLSVQRCFLLLQCTSQDETLEILTPKGKLFVTALTPDAEIIFEIRPFLPQGLVAANTATRHYLGCLGLNGRVMIEHQDKEVILFPNRWMAVKPDGQQESFDGELPAGIAATIQELKNGQVNPDVTAISSLVQSSEGMDELTSIANGNHVHSQQITPDQRSLAAMWCYGLGQLEPAFTVLNDPKLKSYWDVHMQAVASCLQSDPAASSQLSTAARRFGFNSPIDTRFVGIDPRTVKMSQVSELITDLEHAQVARRVLAIHSLGLLTKETYGYDPTASTDRNRSAITLWKQWLADSASARISIKPANELVPGLERQ
ncbi:MAG: hypothetical protein Q8M16_12795 [Pirellulaceae bacterium]|nr:hypothetical protein [Pirellulaceae bacterium]